jgi:hypothetical protein
MLDVNHRHPDVAGPVRTRLWCYGLRATAGLDARYATLMPMAGFYMLRIGPRLMTALVGLSAIGISSPVGAATPMPFTLWPCWLWWALGWPPGY